MAGLMQLPGYDIGSPLLNLAPVNQAIQFGAKMQQQGFENELSLKREKMAQEQFDQQKQDRMTKQAGNLMLAVINDPDPARGKANFQKFISMVPGAAEDLAKNGFDPNDHVSAARAIAAKAGVLPDPLERERADLQNKVLKRQLEQPLDDGSKLMEVNGQIVRVPRQGEASVLYTAQPKPAAPTFKEVNGAIVELTPGGQAREVYKGEPNFDKLPEFAAKSAGFAARMVDAEKNIQALMSPKDKSGKGGFDPTSAKVGALNSTTGTPFETATNFALRSPEHQRYMQSAEQWIRSFLRKESGAAIGRDEFQRDFKVYFPQPGDDATTIAQKADARLQAVKSFVGETRGFFARANPEQARNLDELSTGRTAAPAPTSTPRQRYVNPQTQEVIEWNGSQWIPVQ